MDLQLKTKILEIIKDNNHEIIEEGDWWYGLPEHDINVFQMDGEGDFIISVYKMDKDGNFDYNQWENLPSLTYSQMLYL